jgi:thiol-disulfide isomerase/thioredoxin
MNLPRLLTRVVLGALVASALVVLAMRRMPAALLASPAGFTRGASDSLGTIPADEWLNTAAPIAGADLRGDVVLVEYWTYLCYNCKNVEPWMKATQQRYAPRGLRVVGIHTPEFSEERRVENVRRYLDRNGITWPVAIDNGFRVWRRYNTTNAWPAFFVYDRTGQLVFHAAGEGAVGPADAAIQRALANSTGERRSPSPGSSGVRVAAVRRGDSLLVTLTPEAGFKLVRSPANEVWLEGHTSAPLLLLGDRFTGAASGDVRYFDGAVTGAVMLPPGPGHPARGHVVVRYCSTADGVCLRRVVEFAS